MISVVKYIESQLIPMGLILILSLTLHDMKFIERIKKNRTLKITAYVVIVMYYIGIFANALKIALST